ncbi:unnamed protein product, partial [Tuber aestivum]
THVPNSTPPLGANQLCKVDREKNLARMYPRATKSLQEDPPLLDQSALHRIQARIVNSSGEACDFGPGSEGGIEIRCRIEG